MFWINNVIPRHICKESWMSSLFFNREDPNLNANVNESVSFSRNFPQRATHVTLSTTLRSKTKRAFDRWEIDQQRVAETRLVRHLRFLIRLNLFRATRRMRRMLNVSPKPGNSLNAAKSRGLYYAQTNRKIENCFWLQTRRDQQINSWLSNTIGGRRSLYYNRSLRSRHFTYTEANPFVSPNSRAGNASAHVDSNYTLNTDGTQQKQEEESPVTFTDRRAPLDILISYTRRRDFVACWNRN